MGYTMPHGLVTVTPERWEHHYEPNAAYTVYTYPLPHMHIIISSFHTSSTYVRTHRRTCMPHAGHIPSSVYTARFSKWLPSPK